MLFKFYYDTDNNYVGIKSVKFANGFCCAELKDLAKMKDIADFINDNLTFCNIPQEDIKKNFYKLKEKLEKIDFKLENCLVLLDKGVYEKQFNNFIEQGIFSQFAFRQFILYCRDTEIFRIIFDVQEKIYYQILFKENLIETISDI